MLKLAFIDDQNQIVPETRSDYVKPGVAIAQAENKALDAVIPDVDSVIEHRVEGMK